MVLSGKRGYPHFQDTPRYLGQTLGVNRNPKEAAVSFTQGKPRTIGSWVTPVQGLFHVTEMWNCGPQFDCVHYNLKLVCPIPLLCVQVARATPC